MQTADNVAKWFLNRNQVKFFNGETEYLTNLKLQKLLYYAQGMHLAFYGQPLFDDPISAWKYGPVVESVYHTYKHNSNNGIEDFDLPGENFTDAESDTLYFTDAAFGQFSAWKLRDMTHNETPWQTTPQGCIIGVDKIKSYFEANYVEEE